MPANLVKFVYAASATAEQIAAFDANTIYFIGNTHQIYKGSTLYDGGTEDVMADLAILENYIGIFPTEGDYDNLVDYIDKSIAAGDATITNLVTVLENSLSDVATSGAADDITIADANGHFSATNVEDALDELYTAIGDAETDSALSVTKTAGGMQDNYIYRYVFSQGGTAIPNGTIDILKDMVATNGQLVHPTVENPITIDNQTITSGTYIAMTIANGNIFYINVADLIEYNSVSNTTEITLTDTNHTITATVGEIAASKIRYDQNNTVADAVNSLEAAVGTGGVVDGKISTAIQALDADLNATGTTQHAGTFVMSGVTEVDGIITSVDSIEVETAGAAAAAQAAAIAYTDNALTWSSLS